jgi:hypothetical protein
MRIILVAGAVLTGFGLLSEAPAVPGEKKEHSAKTRQAVQNLKADLAAFVFMVYTFPPRNRAGELDSIRLVADPKQVPDKAKRVFPISQKLAAGLIDYLADEGLFDKVYMPPPGIRPPGWYVSVAGGRPPAGQTQLWLYEWAYPLDVKPPTVGVMKYLSKTLDGDARAAVENFRKDADTPKK